jgi:hypothetical protein
MGRLLLVLVLAVGLVALSPPLRRRAEPYVRPALQRVLDPVYRWQTRSRVQELARYLAAQSAAGVDFPSPQEFPSLYRRLYPGENGLDPWGHPYQLRAVDRNVWVVASNGPDGQRNTPDDIVSGPVRGAP